MDKFICEHCGEEFKTDLDLQSHQFNNKHCPSYNENLNTMSNIPAEAKAKIDARLKEAKHQVSSEGLQNIEDDIMFGYSLCLQEKEERMRNIETLLKHRVLLIKSEPDGLIRETMIDNLLIDLF